ncbi:unnamed protein product [Hydatigera taeniaeformis]|uniref:Lectin_legB domain-containing protein n=1 Tax=Hydatigena taeniaeformis TaxID=6205 RepID=A0A0R3WJ16_HYDTA|nr:unnamed protein product [Hydatigera taeniaeformis]
MILRGGPESIVTVNETKFFQTNISESITCVGITESTGILIEAQVCEYEDKKGTATFENHEGAVCRNSGENLQWRLHHNESNMNAEALVLGFVSGHWDPHKDNIYHSVKFKFTIPTENTKSALLLPVVRGFGVRMEVMGPLEKSYGRLGIGMLIYTNETIHPGQAFHQESLFDFGVEEEVGNFLSTVVLLNKREPPEAGDEVDMPPAYVFWRDVCFVDPVNRWSAGRRVVSFQSNPKRHNKPNRHINRSLPQAVFGFKRFNIHLHDNDTVAAVSEWLGFGSPGDGFFAKTNYTDWSFIMALGIPPVASTPVFYRLFIPFFLPILAVVGSLIYVYASQRWGPHLNDGTEATQPLISEVGSDEVDNDDGYPGFDVPNGVHSQGNSDIIEGEETAATPTSSYGAI